ncbi:MAG: LamG domain-containing protein, partial [Planctomycetota bacterium]
AWIRPEGFDIGDARIITKQKTWSSSDIWWMLSTYEDGTALRMRLKTDDGGPDNGTTTMWSEAGHLEAGVWSHVAATYDGSEMRLYHNGVEIISTNKTGTIPADPTAAVAIGNGPLGDPGGLRATFHGLIDDVRVYNKGVTAAEIPDIMRGDTSLAWGPSPSNGATVSIDQATPLSWSPGDKAAQHDVYFGTDRDAVADADTSTAEVYRDRQSVTSYTPPEGVEWGGGPYYWRIDEYNTDATISKGGVWSFTVADFILVDDIEDYDVDNPIWENWRDGLGFITVGGVTHPGNGSGSEVGDPGTPSYTEEGIVHGGSQSMPYWYNNNKTDKMKYSEAKLTLSAPRDWTEGNVKALSLWFRGHPGSVGSFVESPPGTYTMTASGYDIWRTADGVETDEFHFAYKTLSGPGTITAKVESVQNTNGWAKAGVMIRETLDPDSAHAFACITPSNGVASQGRPSAGGTSVSTNQTGITAPHWVKLERDISGHFTISHSANGSTWEPVQNASTLNIPMRTNVYIGLALTAHNAAATCEAVFSSVTITDTVGPQWMHQDIGIQNNDPEPMYVAVANSTGQPAVVYHDDPNAAQIDTWTEWNIDLKDFQDKGINLTDVDSIALGFGNRDNPQVGGAGKMYFDDIRLYRPRCMPEFVKPAADLSNNCVVDYADLEILASAWLGTGHLVSPQQPSEAGLVAHWPLQDGLNDITGNGHDGTAMNGASIVGGALVLDGNQQYVEVAHDPALNLSQAFTIAAFVTLDDTGDRRPIVTKEHMPDASRGWNCWIQDGEPRMQLMDGVKWATTGDLGQSKLTVTSGTTLDPETRYHLAFVYDSTGPEQIYVDGLLQLSEDVVTGTLHVNEQPVQIGAYIWDLAGYHRYLDGSIEDLRIYSRALSEAEIVSLAGEIEPTSEPFDLNVDGVIDFKDFAVLADAWLYEQLWPEW